MVFLRRLLKEKELVLLFVAGFIILILMDTLLVQGSYKDERYRESLMAERLQAEVQSSLEEHVTALISLNVVYQNFTDILPYDFEQYGQAMTANLHGFQRIFYIDPALTIKQVYPQTPENTGLYNYSLNQEKPLATALQQARASKSPTTSRLLPFLNHPRSFWAFIPIYRNNHGTKEFLGYAAGEISLERIMQPLAAKFSKYQMQLVDPSGTQLFPQVNIDPHDPVSQPLDFNLLGQKWTLMLKPLNPASETLLLQRSGLWAGGVLILFLLTLLIQGSKRHKTQLEEAQKQFETIFEASPDGILMLDDRLNLRISNPVLQQWLDKDDAALKEQRFFDVFQCQCPNLQKCRELNFLLCTSPQFAEDLPEVLETQVIDAPEGSPKTLRLNASRIYHEREGLKEEGFICVLGDISTSKELERVKETYVATLTHDLKTPLLAQQMVLESISAGKAGPVTPDQERLLSGAKESVQDLLDMVNITLLFYKLESTHVTLARYPFKLANLAREVMGNLQPLAEKRGVLLELDAGLNVPEVGIDAIQMKRVFHNLISNAISYGEKGSPIRVSIQLPQGVASAEQAENVLIEIANKGKGIAPEELPRIFDKYYSLSRKFKQIGTGLGLYISRRIVELHGGKLWAESEPDKETRFFISLPLVQQVQATSSLPEQPEEEAPV